MTFGTAAIIWILSAGLAYMIARDRAPSQTILATILGFLLGPIGVLLTFLLKDQDADLSNNSKQDRALETTVKEVETELDKPARSAQEISADLAKMKERIGKS